ncbi:MAG TPA: phosphoribosyltransferase, partial [Pelotomaculum sp.]|nr:phosphoribosyltransferase [Pelotomaculum sp.]
IDLIIPRKIGAPHNPEVAIGAVTQDGATIFDQRLMELLGISRGELEDRAAYELNEIRRRMALYGAGRNIGKSGGRQLIVVDDGVATGYTMQAALRSARSYGPKELVLAIPVAPRDTLELLGKEVDRAVCLMVPDDFYAVGQFYESFEQTEDEEVMEIMRRFSDL